MKIHVDLIPQEVFNEYNLQEKISNGYVNICIDGGMNGLSQAGRIAYEELKTHLTKHGYKESIHTPGYWRHAN